MGGGRPCISFVLWLLVWASVSGGQVVNQTNIMRALLRSEVSKLRLAGLWVIWLDGSYA